MDIANFHGTKAAIFDIDEVLLDMLPTMQQLYGEYCHREISDEEFTWHMRNFNKEPERYKDFGVFFNSSPEYFDLPAKKGMVPVLQALTNAGFDIHLISASSSDKEFQAKRAENVIHHYGDIFTSVNCIGSQKKQQLITDIANDYSASFYCDDTPQVVNQSVGATDYSIWLHNSLYEVYAPLLQKNTQTAYKPVDILSIISDQDNCASLTAAQKFTIKTNGF